MTAATGLSDSPLRSLLGYRLRRAWIGIRADLAETLRPLDLRMLTYTALVLIEANPGLSQARLAGLMTVERPNVVAIVDELARRGLVCRRRDPGDRRAYALDLTPRGRALSRAATEAVERHEARLFGALSAAERRAIDAALERLSERL
ncbi:MarR family winged helix-turn-helix transcriptional regulator [Oceaniglobus roseus]|uniref:MarR family winged helix-turn-helix transcriptional regulator n=1 Tax=Oceaniglobus roseus TaxID=1737570 RepID=UPI000C7F5585|nr:MarR family transcriptional regulator [Kandeliimicrobium roseum]